MRPYRLLVLLATPLLSALCGVSSSGANTTATPPALFGESDLRRLEGDYSVSVYPKPFGFLVRGGTLHVKVGGLAAAGDAAPLVQQPEGRFVLSEGHPNAFQFHLVGDSVQFRFWSGGQSFEGARSGSAPPTAAAGPRPPADSRTRRDLMNARPALEAAAGAAGATSADRLALARSRYESGEFASARASIAADVASAEASDAIIELASRLDFLLGRLDEAEAGYRRLHAARAGDVGKQVQALVGSLFVLYQQDRFKDMAGLQFPAGVRLPLWNVAKAFTDRPYRIEWRTGARSAFVRFVDTDPLPVLPITVDGVRVNVILDTGGDQLILDDQLARSMGVAVIDSAMGSFAGGLTSRVGFGRVGRVQLGDVTLHDVPVQTLSAKRFTFDARHPVGGILGTSILRQFLSTVDYRRARLVLEERSVAARAARSRKNARQRAVSVPFVLDATHLMYARGGLEDADSLTLFVDSGLASEASIVAPRQTLEVLGIPVPATRPTAPDVGGGAGSFEEGFFDLARVRLGALEQRGVRGEYGALTPDSYWARGFIQDALLSHRFLRRHASWTIDFDGRRFELVR